MVTHWHQNLKLVTRDAAITRSREVPSSFALLQHHLTKSSAMIALSVSKISGEGMQDAELNPLALQLPSS